MNKRQRLIHLLAWVVLLPAAIATIIVAVRHAPDPSGVRAETLDPSP